jgi:hypothetical protein
MTDDPFAKALQLARVFEELGIDYVLGGSLASSIHGEPRTTHDLDFVADLRPHHVSAFLEAVQAEYFADESFVRQSVVRRDCFQLVHRRDYLRVDVFLTPDRAFDREKQRRALRMTLDPATGASLRVTSAEDIVLQKLLWFRKGGEVSDRQWRDVLAVLKANRAPDLEHLKSWAQTLGISDLLLRARREAGLPSTGEP